MFLSHLFLALVLIFLAALVSHGSLLSCCQSFPAGYGVVAWWFSVLLIFIGPAWLTVLLIGDFRNINPYRVELFCHLLHNDGGRYGKRA